VTHDAPGTYLDHLREILVDAGVVQLEIATAVLGQRLDADEVEMLTAFRRLGWHAVRLDPPGTGAWVTLVHVTDERVGLRRFGHDGEPVDEEAWFTLDATGVDAIAAALHT
jgi:hypothetical protein